MDQLIFLIIWEFLLDFRGASFQAYDVYMYKGTLYILRKQFRAMFIVPP